MFDYLNRWDFRRIHHIETRWCFFALWIRTFRILSKYKIIGYHLTGNLHFLGAAINPQLQDLRIQDLKRRHKKVQENPLGPDGKTNSYHYSSDTVRTMKFNNFFAPDKMMEFHLNSNYLNLNFLKWVYAYEL